MGPWDGAVVRAQELFADPTVRARVKVWHDEQVTFLDMIERLGFSDLVSAELRGAIAALKPAEVAILRKAFVATIDRAGSAGPADMPIDCDIPAVTGPVEVIAVETAGQPRARILPRP